VDLYLGHYASGLERESLDLSIRGSLDGKDWGMAPILRFSRKFYCGAYRIAVNPRAHAGVKYVRAQWSADRWGSGAMQPLFNVFVSVHEPFQKAA
jgi:hypothetical protein